MTPSLSTAPAREHIKRGIIYVMICVSVFGIVNAMTKWQVAIYPTVEVLFFRSLFSIPVCLVVIVAHGGIRTLHTKRFSAHIIPGTSYFLSIGCMFAAFRYMPLGDAMALTYAAPLFATLLSIVMLGEKVGVHRWGAVLVGFAGVLLMVRPGSGVVEIGAIFAIVNAILTAWTAITIRQLSTTESVPSLFFYQVMIGGLLTSLMMPFVWVTPNWRDAAMLAAIGLLSAVGQFCWTMALRSAPATVTMPFIYTGLLWATFYGYLIWGDVPTPILILGAILVMCAGIYIVYREAVRRPPDALPLPPSAAP